LKEGWEYIHWGGWNKDALNCFFRHFGMSSFLGLVTIIGVIGVLILLYNLEKNLHNGIVAKVVKISNRNSEAIGYIATYIVPFLTSDFSSLFETYYRNSTLQEIIELNTPKIQNSKE
jgi:hypothetical protein